MLRIKRKCHVPSLTMYRYMPAVQNLGFTLQLARVWATAGYKHINT